jgi:hypothetical protein
MWVNTKNKKKINIVENIPLFFFYYIPNVLLMSVITNIPSFYCCVCDRPCIIANSMTWCLCNHRFQAHELLFALIILMIDLIEWK